MCFTRPYFEEGTGRVRLASGVYNFSHAQENHASTLSLDLLHKRTGHPSFSMLSKYLGYSNQLTSSPSTCFICFQEKQSRSSFPVSNNISQHLFDLIHCDIWGPYKHKSICGSYCFLTSVDDCSQAPWIYSLTKVVFAVTLSIFFSNSNTV